MGQVGNLPPIVNRRGAQDLARVLLNIDTERHFRRPWRQAFLVIAGLVTQLAGHHRGPGRGSRRRLEVSNDFEGTAENRQRRRRKIVLLKLGFRIDNLNGLERLFGPSQFQRDQIFVRRLIAVDVIPLPQLAFEFHFASGAALDAQPFRSRQAEDPVTLCA